MATRQLVEERDELRELVRVERRGGGRRGKWEELGGLQSNSRARRRFTCSPSRLTWHPFSPRHFFLRRNRWRVPPTPYSQGRDLVVVQLNNEVKELGELQGRFDDLAQEADASRTELEAAKDASAFGCVDKAREHEWTLRFVALEIEAQAQWWQNVAESLQQRLQ